MHIIATNISSNVVDVTIDHNYISGYSLSDNITGEKVKNMVMVKLLQQLVFRFRNGLDSEKICIKVREDDKEESIVVNPRAAVFQISECCPFNIVNLIGRLRHYATV